MHLVVFDIDGTLTQTMKVDEQCYVRALADVCGFRDVDTDWSNYKHTTDSGIFHEIYKARLQRSPSPAEISVFRQHFVGLLVRASSKTSFKSVAGTPLLLSRLTAGSEYRVALATGAWRDSARLKMASAGLRYESYPAASSDDAMERESIIRLSTLRAVERYGKFDSAVYVGDGLWDARASRNIGIPFIGIANTGRGARLTAEGAVCVMPDFSDPDLFFATLDKIATKSPAAP